MNEILREELEGVPSATRLFFENIYNSLSPLGASGQPVIFDWLS